jgi:pimeloyl-ACP methyl ester carboxylesterase
VLFLHGFGSTKEDYADFAHIPNLADGGFIAFDAPGFGRSTSSDLRASRSSFSSMSRTPF